MSDFLSRMAKTSEARVRAARSGVGEAALLARARARPDPPRLSLFPHTFDVIAEHKPRSPLGVAFGANGPRAAAERAAAYARSGACAVSVLTERTAFGGSLDDLAAISLASTLPAMRKDFLVDPYQVIEARAHGASGVLLVARLVDHARLNEMIAAADELALFSVVEAFDLADFERAVEAVSAARGTAFLGVNARDLHTLEVDRETHRRLARRIPAGYLTIAESGLASADDAARVAGLGYRAALVGSALMRAADPARLLAAMIAAGRAAAAECEVKR